jgi:RNA polymerase sigma-70 factor (ECF subfamily)
MTQADLVKDPAPKPDELAERREWRDTLRQAMERLPERQRAVVEMREIEGLTYPEIAKQLGVSERTAKSDYAKAMETLRTRLQAQDAPDQNPGGEAQ